MSQSLRTTMLKGSAWAGVERFGTQAVGFVISIVLARLLTPGDYGLVGMFGVFLAFSNMFIDCGFTTALIQKKDKTDVDYCTVFWCNVGIALVCYAALFFAAPFIATFYRTPLLSSLVRVMGLSLLLNALFTVQVTRLTANVDFKTQARASLLNCVLSGALGITLAYNGAGVWALVAQSLFSGGFLSIVYWKVSGWRPRFAFSRASFKSLFGFGSRIMVTNLIHTTYANLSPLIIGRYYTPADLGYFSRGESLASLPGNLFQSVLGRVIYPVLSSIQDNEERLRAVYRKYLRIVTSVIVPSMLLFAAVADPFVRCVLGEKWRLCVPFVQILAIGWMIDPLINVNLSVLYVKGRPDVVLRLEWVKKTIAITLILVSVQYGVLWLCVAKAVYSYVALFLNLRACGPFIGMGIWRQFREVAPIYLGSAVIAGLAWSVCAFWRPQPGFALWLELAAVSLVGFSAYLAYAWFMRFDVVGEALGAIRKFKEKTS